MMRRKKLNGLNSMMRLLATRSTSIQRLERANGKSQSAHTFRSHSIRLATKWWRRRAMMWRGKGTEAMRIGCGMIWRGGGIIPVKMLQSEENILILWWTRRRRKQRMMCLR